MNRKDKLNIAPMPPYRSFLFRSLLVCCVFVFFHHGAFAAWYQVEVVIFEYIEPDADGELWYDNPGLPQRAGSIELITETMDEVGGVNPESSQTGEAMNLTPFLVLPKKYHRLDGVVRVLKLSKEYRPQLHIAWRQPGSAHRSALAVHLENTLFEPEAERPPGRADWPAAGEMYAPTEVLYDGFIRLRGSRFLYLDVDMAYFPESFENEDTVLPEQEQEPGGNENRFNDQQADYVRMMETRRIKLNEIHYFDHPLFGVIIQVSRLRKKRSDELAAPETFPGA